VTSNARTPLKSGRVNISAPIESFFRVPSATEELKSGSNSTSFQVAEAVTALPLALQFIPVTDCVLIEYPNLPAPYKPPAASPEPDVLPNISEFLST